MTGTTTTEARRLRWLPAALATGIAALLALALFVGSTGHAAAEEGTTVTDEALTDALTGAEATLAPAIALLSQLVEGGLLPANATDALRRVLDRLRDRAPSPGAVCRRAANADQAPGTVLERCRDFANDHSDRGDRDPFALCRRAANADQAPDTVIERCRELAGDRSDRSDRLDRPERPDVRPDTRPVRRPQVRPDRARLLGPPVAAQPVAVAGVSLP